MVLKYILNKNKLKCYLIDFMVICLISFFGSFIFLVKLFDPLLRNFIINLLLFNREYINNFGINNRQSLMNTPLLAETNDNIRNKNKSRTAIFKNNFEIINHQPSYYPQR